MQRIAKIKRAELRRCIVETVERVGEVLPVSKVLQLIGMTATRLGRWKRNVAVCLSVPPALCRRACPNQLTAKEISAIRNGFADPRFVHWPAVSVAWYLVNTKQVTANVGTITRYAKLLGIAERKRVKKHRRRGSVMATRPNQIWHPWQTEGSQAQGT